MITINTSTYEAYQDLGDFESGGALEISCLCGFRGWADVDYDGRTFFGDCPSCDEGFEANG